jgi:hypothetical protein
VTFQTDSLELAGDLAQDLFSATLKLTDLDCQDARFPPEMQRLKEIVAQIE